MGHAEGELRARGKIDFLGQPPDHLAEGADFVLAIAAGDQKIGRVPQRALAAFSRSSRDRVIQIAQKRFRLTHGLKTSNLTEAACTHMTGTYTANPIIR